MSDDLINATIEQMLKWNQSDAGEANRFKLIMHHRTIEAMNGLSLRLDKLHEQTEESNVQAKANNAAQEKQQRAMVGLTLVIALATVAYTVTTVWSTAKTMSGQQTVYVGGSGAVAESAAIHMGVDVKGRPSICINGTAYGVPAPGDTTIKPRFADARADGLPAPQLNCRS